MHTNFHISFSSKWFHILIIKTNSCHPCIAQSSQTCSKLIFDLNNSFAEQDLFQIRSGGNHQEFCFSLDFQLQHSWKKILWKRKTKLRLTCYTFLASLNISINQADVSKADGVPSKLCIKSCFKELQETQGWKKTPEKK